MNNKNDHNKNLLAIAAMAVVLIGGALLATSNGNAFARSHNSQATAQDDHCGNGDFPFNPQCLNVDASSIGDGSAQAPVGLQEGGFAIRVVNVTINNVTTPTPVNPPGPSPESKGCDSATTVYDAQLSQQLGPSTGRHFIVGSEVCLQKPGQNPDASIVNSTATPPPAPIPQSVRVDQSDAGNCLQHPGSATAIVNSGSPPDGPVLAIGQTVCITLT